MRIATFNLYQFLEPPNYWYERDTVSDTLPWHKNTYDEATRREWTRKRDWIAAQIRRLDADIIVFQEVFSVESLRSLVAGLGYPQLLTVETPRPSSDDPLVWMDPIVAIAARHPGTLLPNYLPPSDPDHPGHPFQSVMFSRWPVVARFDIPGHAPVTVVGLHLKSKSARANLKGSFDETAWEAQADAEILGRAEAIAKATSARVREAAAVFAGLVPLLAAPAPDNRVIIAGDLNDTPDSPTLQALGRNLRIDTVYGKKVYEMPPEIEAGLRKRVRTFELYDSFDLALPKAVQRPPTTLFDPDRLSAYDTVGQAIDQILVSRAFVTERSDKKTVSAVRSAAVLNDHLQQEETEERNKLTSDHAPVVIEIAPQ